MKQIMLNTPASCMEGAKKALDAGADEIYCGVRLKGIKHVTFNGRPSYGSLDDFSELTRVTDYAHAHGKKVNFVLNLPFMADILELLAKPHIKQAVQANVDNFIVADIGLLLLLDKMKVKTPIHIGSFATVRNCEAIKFYTQFPVTRIIAPPDTTLPELNLLSDNPFGIEVEAFVHGQGCSNVNGNCYLSHSYKKQSTEFPSDPLWRPDNDKSFISIGVRNPCMLEYDVTDWKNGMQAKSRCLNVFPFCSLCFLPDLRKTGVSALKIEGRCQPVEYQERVAREYHTLLHFLENDDREGYEAYLADLKENVPKLALLCQQKRCYYERENSHEKVDLLHRS